MFPLLMAVLGAVIVVWQLAITQPKQIAFMHAVTGSVEATNFWTYRSALTQYRYANPTATGTVSDGNLTFEIGYIRNPAWENVIQNKILYTYSNAALSNTTVDAIATRGGRTLMIGVSESGGKMTSLTGGASNFVLPAVIPIGAVVVIGN